MFDAILCLLSAASYTLRFAEDLEDVFPHVPFPARVETFREAVRIGREIRAVEPSRASRARRTGRPVSSAPSREPRGALAPSEDDARRDHALRRRLGARHRAPRGGLGFAVSGYRLVPRWLEGRRGLPCDLELVTEFRDLCARVAELLTSSPLRDMVLDAALHETLSCEALGSATDRAGSG